MEFFGSNRGRFSRETQPRHPSGTAPLPDKYSNIRARLDVTTDNFTIIQFSQVLNFAILGLALVNCKIKKNRKAIERLRETEGDYRETEGD